jgi:DNA-binding transcriptional LysR family regulator
VPAQIGACQCSNHRMASLENFRLVVFRAVAEQFSFRKAAEELYLTQPAVSLQIKALEEDIGVQLFDRAGAHITLTSAGQVLLNYCEQVRTLLAQTRHEIAALSGEHAGQLALGASTTIAQYVLPRLLGKFCREHPRVHPTLISGNTEHIVEAVAKQKISLGFIEGPARSREVNTKPFLEDELVLIASTSHEWADQNLISCAELASTPLLMRERGSGTRHVIELALERQRASNASRCRLLWSLIQLKPSNPLWKQGSELGSSRVGRSPRTRGSIAASRLWKSKDCGSRREFLMCAYAIRSRAAGPGP